MNKFKRLTTCSLQDRAQYVTEGAIKYARIHGYSEETGAAFAQWAQAYAPEVQGFGNLFDYFMSKQD